MIAHSIRNAHRHGRASAALSLASVLLLTACVSASTEPAEAPAATEQVMAAVDQTADEQRRQLQEARDVNADARRNAQQLQRRIEALQAEAIDRGLLLTLDDVLFAGNSTRLTADGSERLDELIGFLKDYPHRGAQIESSVACKAGAGYDATLSRRRAEAVASYLSQRGVASARVSAQGKQESWSFDGDCDAHGLQRNRQVVVIVEDVLT